MINNFSVNMIKNGKALNISYFNGIYSWWYDGKHVILPKYKPEHEVEITLATNYILVNGWEVGEPFVPYNLKVYNFEGDYLWNIGDIARNICPRMDAFYYIKAHTKSTLAEPPWPVLFGKCTLNEGHEYITAYDGSDQWLFDITDRKFINRVFTH